MHSYPETPTGKRSCLSLTIRQFFDSIAQATKTNVKMSAKSYQTPTTPAEVRDYVLGETQGAGRSADTLLINVQHSNLKQTRLVELRMDRRATISEVKQRLYQHTGTRPDSMQLILRNIAGDTKAVLTDEASTLAAYGAQLGDSMLLVDNDPYSVSANGWLEDTSLVKKYVMPDEVYDKKENTYRAYKRKMKEKDPNWNMTSALAKRLNNNSAECVDTAEEAPKISVGDRVEVFPGGKRGTVKFVGRGLQKLPDGWWVGVGYDEPVGKNDGCVKGVRYFDVPQGFGGLVRPSKVTVGDFPPLDDVDEESEDEI